MESPSKKPPEKAKSISMRQRMKAQDAILALLEEAQEKPLALGVDPDAFKQQAARVSKLFGETA